MTDGHNTYFNAVDWAKMQEEHPTGDAFIAFAKKSRDEIRAHQEKLFRRLVERAWKTKFYQHHWG
jgi:phenylacetate-CoA ligase